MKINCLPFFPSLLTRLLPRGALLAAFAFLSTATAHAQAQFAGTYVGTINTRVTAPVIGTIESTSGAYIATVSADGTISLAGTLTGTVSSTGAVTFNGGSALAALGIRSATIANNQLSSNYGDVLGNGTTQFRLNGSTSFTAAPGGGTGGGGTGTIPGITSGGGVTTSVGRPFVYQIIASNAPTSYSLRGAPSWVSVNQGGIVTGTAPAAGTFTFEVEATNATGTGRRSINIVVNADTGTGGGTTTGGELLAYYSFNNPTNPYNDDSGRGFHLTPVGGTVTSVTGRAASAIATNGVRLRVPVNSTFSVSAYTISYFVKVQGPGNWNPRVVAVQIPGTSSHYYGTYINGATTAARQFASYHISGGAARIILSGSAATLPTNTTSDWQHVAVTNTGSTVTIYLNGNAVNTQGNSGALNSFSNAMLMIGGSDNGLDLFQGQLDEVRIYNRAVTAAEVTTLSTGAALGTAATGTNTAVALAADVIAVPANLTGYRSRVGQSFQFLLTGLARGAVWGTDVYTDDSSVAAAAVHAGVVAAGETKAVTVTILPGQASYAASTRNGVSSASWGGWSGSFSFAGAGAVNTAPAATARPAAAPGFVATTTSLVSGGRLVCPVTVTGGGTYTYRWYLNGVLIPGATVNPYIVERLTTANAGTYSADVTNSLGTTRVTAGTVTVGNAGAPSFAVQPFNKVVAPGDTFALGTVATGTGVAYQWFRNNVALPGETGSILLRNTTNAGDSGLYTVRASNSSGSVTSSPATVSLSPTASTLRNISVRTNLEAGGEVTPGFVIRGSGTKRVLVRAIGPGLTQLGVPGASADPKFEVYRGSTKIAENDTWDASLAAVFPAVGAFSLPAGSRDAAALVTLNASAAGENYSVRVSGVGDAAGITLVEVYDADTAPTSKLVNVSVLGQSGVADDVLILGLSLQGTGQRTLLVRGVGPTIGSLFGVPGSLGDPQLTVYDKDTRAVIANDDWNGADFVSELLQASTYVGAFALPGGSADAATLSLLDPGTYTIQVKGSAESTGRAIIEVYEVP